MVGYAESGSTTSTQLTASSGELSVVGVDGVNVTRDGAAVTPVSAEALQLLHEAHARHRSAELLVGNFDDRIGDFSPAIGDALLGSPSNIDSVVAQLAAEVQKHGWDGVTIDLESLSGRHPAGLTRLVTELQHRLGAHHDVSICLMATTDHYADLGYDLRALGRAADHVVLMAYDQHGPTWSGPGPIGGTPWVKQTLRPLQQTIPALKIELGIAGYGYTWPRRGTGSQVSDVTARHLTEHNAPVWDATQQEWRATTPSGTFVWWSDRKTIAARIAFARTQHLGGIAVWSLGLSDPLPDTAS